LCLLNNFKKIEEDAFRSGAEKIICSAGSYAEQYAKDNYIECVTE